MGKASSSKKIQRVQRAGVSRSAGTRRPIGFPAAVIGILIVGTVLVFLARDARVTASAEEPVANVDHWHAAYGFYLCDQYLPNLSDPGVDPLGIHSHGDGLIHIHPFGTGASGSNATMQVFADAAGVTFSGSTVELPVEAGGQVLDPEGTCTNEDGEEVPAEVHLLRWPPQATDNVDPDVIDAEYGSVRFTEDGEIFAFVMVPEGTDLEELPLPPSVEQLANPLEAEGVETPTPQGSVPAGETPAPAEGQAPAEPTPTTSAAPAPGN